MVKHKKAFSLLEIMVAVAILGVVAAFAVPSYTKSRDRSYERTAYGNLQIIAEAMKLHYAREGTYPDDTAASNVSDINSFLSIGIIGGTQISYSCFRPSPPPVLRCRADYPSGPWQLSTDFSPDAGIMCSMGPCPTCDNNPANCLSNF